MDVSTEQPWTIGRLLDWTARFLADKGSESPRLDAEVLLADVLGCERIALYTRYDEEAGEESRQRYRDLIRRRIEGCPVAYLVGRKEFFSLRFEVNPAVLIPRPDTECVVIECLRLLKGIAEPTVLDVGTGSGAIAVAVARQNERARVTATDISPEALAVAQRNAARHGVAERIRFVQGDLLAPFAPGENFDLIACNPPYIPSEEIPRLPAGVREFEPRMALDGGRGGFVIFDRLIDQAGAHLKPGGWLVVEIGAPQEAVARQRLAAITGYELRRTVLDGSGHPRVLLARWIPKPL
jgi:release factor glutamine methyltransferase